MKSLTLKAASVAATLALAVLPLQALAAPTNAEAVLDGLSYLDTQQGADGQVAGFPGITSWAVMAYAAAGEDPDTVTAPGGVSLLAYLKAHHPAAAAPAADWERDILAITAAGGNPYNFGGANYVAALKALHTGGQLGGATGVNDDIFGVLSLISARVATSDTALSDALAFVLAHQHADGGFSYTTDAATASDVDDTSAAIMALQVAKDAGLTVPAAAITNAKAYMLGTKNADGGFPYDPNTPAEWGGPVSNVSTTAWVVMALESLGQGASADSVAAQTYIRSTQQANGSFPYNLPTTGGDTFNSAYAVLALAGASWPQAIYEGTIPTVQTDAPAPSASPTPSATPTPTPTPSLTPRATPTPAVTPAPTPAAGSVLGAATGPGILPAVGAHSSIATPALLILLALTTFLAIRARRLS